MVGACKSEEGEVYTTIHEVLNYTTSCVADDWSQFKLKFQVLTLDEMWKLHTIISYCFPWKQSETEINKEGDIHSGLESCFRFIMIWSIRVIFVMILSKIELMWLRSGMTKLNWS